MVKGKHNIDISLNDIFQDEYDCCMVNYNSTVKTLNIVCTIKKNVDNFHNVLIYEGGIDVCCPEELDYVSVQISNRQTYILNFSKQNDYVLSMRTDTNDGNFSPPEVQIHTIKAYKSDNSLPPQRNKYQINGIRKRVVWCVLILFTVLTYLLLKYHGEKTFT